MAKRSTLPHNRNGKETDPATPLKWQGEAPCQKLFLSFCYICTHFIHTLSFTYFNYLILQTFASVHWIKINPWTEIYQKQLFYSVGYWLSAWHELGQARTSWLLKKYSCSIISRYNDTPVTLILIDQFGLREDRMLIERLEKYKWYETKVNQMVQFYVRLNITFIAFLTRAHNLLKILKNQKHMVVFSQVSQSEHWRNCFFSGCSRASRSQTRSRIHNICSKAS